MSSRPKVEDISARFRSICFSVDPAPNGDHSPRRDGASFDPFEPPSMADIIWFDNVLDKMLWGGSLRLGPKLGFLDLGEWKS
jgi:hypothetical protein